MSWQQFAEFQVNLELLDSKFLSCGWKAAYWKLLLTMNVTRKPLPKLAANGIFWRFFSQVQHEKEQECVCNLLSTEGTLPGKQHLFEFLEAWEMSSSPDQKE